MQTKTGPAKAKNTTNSGKTPPLGPLKKDWQNEDNADFYENLSISATVTNSVLGGLESGDDLSRIEKYLKKAHSILEVGAGHGRVLAYLIKQGFQAKLTAIERSTKLCRLLRKKFSVVDVHQADIKTFHTIDKYDLILWMFSGISDFTKEEQLPVFMNLASHLEMNGVFILDTFSHEIKPANALSKNDQSYVITIENKILYGYIPSPEEIYHYAKESGFKNISHIFYETPTGSKRTLYTLEK